MSPPQPPLPRDAAPLQSTADSPPRPHLIRFVIYIVFLIVYGFLAAMYVFIGDRTWWGEWVTIWPPVLWIVILLPLAVLSLDVRRWKQTMIALVLVLFFVLIALYLEVGRFWMPSSPEKQAGSFRVMTWNVNSASAGVEALAERLHRFAPDLCLLQESPDPSTIWNELTPDMLGWSDFYWHDMGDCAALSRYPIMPLDTEPIGPWEAPQLLRIDVPTSRVLLVANVRLMLPSLALNPLSAAARRRMISDHASRRDQFRQLAALIDTRAREIGADHVILAGDFNTPARMPSLAPLRRAGWRDVWQQAGRGWGGTMTTQFPVARIDQCWASHSLKVLSAHAPPDDFSDHRPLIVDFKLE